MKLGATANRTRFRDFQRFWRSQGERSRTNAKFRLWPRRNVSPPQRFAAAYDIRHDNCDPSTPTKTPYRFNAIIYMGKNKMYQRIYTK
jgi:hypothetical protein